MTASVADYVPAIVVIAILAASSSASFAQNIQSPEVHADARVTFRLRAPEAQAVSVSVSGAQLQMTKDESGIWEGTSEVLSAGLHEYSFSVDGTTMIDPSNRMVKKWLTLASMVEVPGDPPLLTEFTAVPHGVVHRAIYDSQSVAAQRPVVVYTPPGYASGSDDYPLVILMHGFGDDEWAWTEVGRVHLIADNLIARGLIQPVVIAMPFGHPVPVPAGRRIDDYFVLNNELFEQDLRQDLLPFLESSYRVRESRTDRAIVGLSMGGGQALDTGLKNIDAFASIGAFSAAAPQWTGEQLLEKYPALQGPNPPANQLEHLFIPIGDSDFLLSRNETFVAQLKANGVTHAFRKTKGGHEWKVWREYLPEFLQLVAGNQ